MSSVPVIPRANSLFFSVKVPGKKDAADGGGGGGGGKLRKGKSLARTGSGAGSAGGAEEEGFGRAESDGEDGGGGGGGVLKRSNSMKKAKSISRTGSLSTAPMQTDGLISALASSQKSAYSRSLLPIQWVSFDTGLVCAGCGRDRGDRI